MNLEAIKQLESLGCTVITGSKYCVVDKGNKDGKRIIHNLDDNGEPVEITGVCIVSSSEQCKIYHGNNLNQLKSRMQVKTPDIKQGSINDDKTIEEAVRDGDIPGVGDMGRWHAGMRTRV